MSSRGSRRSRGSRSSRGSRGSRSSRGCEIVIASLKMLRMPGTL